MNGLFASRTPQGVESARWNCFSLVLGIACALLLAARDTTALAQCCTTNHAPGCASAQRAQDEIWFVDTRTAGCAAKSALELPRVAVQRRLAPGRWQRANVSELLAADPGMQTVIWVHGNRVSSGEARQRGWEFYQTLARQADERPMRMIIWSWPADQIRGQLQDVRYKASLTVPAAFQLARFMRHMNPATPVGLAGFSYGARVITGAMHLQAGGSLGSYRLPKVTKTTGPTARAVLWASAINHDWLMPGRYHGQALHGLQHATFLNNSCDRALQRYRFIDKCSRPEAIGYWGVAGMHSMGPNKAKIKQQDVACLIGKIHTDSSYIYSSSIMRTTWRGLAAPMTDSNVATVAAAAKPAAPKPAAVAKK